MGKLIISKSLVERVALDLHNRNDLFSSSLLSPDANAAMLAEAKKQAINNLMRAQPELLNFFRAGTVGLGDESKSVGLFLCEVIFETFRLAGRATRPIDSDKFSMAFEANVELGEKTKFAHPKFAKRYFWQSGAFHQRALIDYVVDVLVDGHKTCPRKLPYDDFLAQLFVTLKSIIDVLDKDSAVDAESS